MLQVTMVIAVFTIFVFGGSITSVAKKLEVLETEDDRKHEAHSSTGGDGLHHHAHNYLLEFLTEDKVYKEEFGLRHTEAGAEEPEDSAVNGWAKLMEEDNLAYLKELSTEEYKRHLSEDGLEMAIQGAGVSCNEMKLNDKIDELRHVIPGLPTDQYKKMLEDSGMNVKSA